MRDLLHITPLSQKEFFGLSDREQFVYLCKLGHLAPSTHNTQPWRFFIDYKNDTVKLYLHRKFILPVSDVVGRQAVISVGCVLANMLIGASALGISADVEIREVAKKNILPSSTNKKSPRYICIAKVKLKKERKEPSLEARSLFTSIFTRKVVRAEYDARREIPKPLVKELFRIVDGKIIKLRAITDRIRRNSVAEFQAQADSFVINSPRFSTELGEWLLPNNTKASLGMPGIGFGLQDRQALRIHEGLLGKGALEPEDGLRFALAGKMGIETSPFIGIITIAQDTVTNWIKAGRAFEQMFLTLEREGINVAIHAGIVEVGLINKIFAVSLGTKRKIAVLFRAGWVRNKEDAKRPLSPRLPIEKVILSREPF